MNRQSTEDFRAVKLFCVILQWSIDVIHLSKPTECTTPRVNPNVNYGLRMIRMCQCRFISCNVPLWCGMLMVEAVHVWGRRDTGTF